VWLSELNFLERKINGFAHFQSESFKLAHIFLLGGENRLLKQVWIAEKNEAVVAVFYYLTLILTI
jgi:hypothetical protein